VTPAHAHPPRVALVHEWLVQRGGSELVVAQFQAAFPTAPLHVLFDHMPAAIRREIGLPPRGAVHTSWLQHLPGVAQHYRLLAPLMPSAVRSLQLRDADVVLSSHHAVAKGVRLAPGQRHLCYCHSPPRYAYAQQERYLSEHGYRGARAALARRALARLRDFDRATASGVHRFIANSHTVAARIREAYGRDSVVIRPPVDTDYFTPSGSTPREPDRYVAASRLVPYKQMATIVRAFRSLAPRRLVVIGDGPGRAELERLAADAPHITLLGEVPRPQLREELRRAAALIFAAEEDAGILPVEALACGTPVLAYGRGGAAETVQAGVTGAFFEAQTPEAIAAAVRAFETSAPPAAATCRAHAEPHGTARFREAIASQVQQLWEAREPTV